MRGGIGAVQAIREDVGVGADHAEKIVEGVGNAVQGMGGEVFVTAVVVGSEIQHWRTLSEMSLGLAFGTDGEERGMEHLSCEVIERKAMRRARLKSSIVQVLYRRIEKRKDGNSRKLVTNFLDDTKALKAPGMKIDGEGVPPSGGEKTIKLTRRLRAMNVERGRGGFRKRMGNSQPGRIFAQEEDLENRVVHRSFWLLLTRCYEHVHG